MSGSVERGGRDRSGRFHTVYGIAAILVFAATGAWMRRAFPEAWHGDDAVRFLYRGNHLYILGAGCVNVALGLHLRRLGGWRAWAQGLGSLLLVAAPVLFLAAFVHEPPTASPERPLTSLGAFALLGGVVAHWAAALGQSRT